MVRALFPPRILAINRATSGANMPDLGTYTPQGTFVPDDEGGGTYTPGTPVEFWCRTWPLSAQDMERLVSDQIREANLEGIAYELDTDLESTGTLTVERHETGNIDSYEVKGIIEDPTFVMHRRAIVKRTGTVEGS